MHHAVRCFGLSICLTWAVLAQNTGGAASGGGTRAGGGTTTGAGASPSTQPPRQATQPSIQGAAPDAQMPIFLAGRVMMDDGTAPATSISIMRTCSGSPHTVAYTDSKGRFNFQWGDTGGILPNASEPMSGFGMSRVNDDGGMRNGQTGNAASPSLIGCELAASAPGFRSDRLNLGGHRATDNPELGTIILHRIAGVEGTSVSATALNAPRDAQKAWEKGSQLLRTVQNMSSGSAANRTGKLRDAEKELRKAVDIYPKYANAWLDLGRARQQQGNSTAAREAFLKALEADGKLVEPWVELGEQAAREQNWADAARHLDRALQLDPVDYPRLWFEDAVANYNIRNFERAEKNLREALKQQPGRSDPHANQLLGIILLGKQDYPGAREALRTYVKLLPNAPDVDVVMRDLAKIDEMIATVTP